ncbi:hypothetical protein C4623_04415 [Escherichia albertii]|nr:hypothetical protein C4623_04415 [Escherichia albertii]
MPETHAETSDGTYAYLKTKHSCADQNKHRPSGKVSQPDESCPFSLAKCSSFGANCANHRFQTLRT